MACNSSTCNNGDCYKDDQSAAAQSSPPVDKPVDPCLYLHISHSSPNPRFVFINQILNRKKNLQKLLKMESTSSSVSSSSTPRSHHNSPKPQNYGCQDLGEGLRRIREGAAVIRTYGDCSRSGNICETVRNVRSLMSQIRTQTNMDEDEVFTFAKVIGAPCDIVAQTKQMGRLPVVQFAAGGIATPADAAMMMQLGCDGVVIESEIFDSADPFKRARAIVQAVRHYNDAHVLAESCSILADSMADLNLGEDNVEQIANEETR